MSRNVERVVSIVLVLIFSTLFFITGREGANTTIDDAQATAAALQNTVNELLDMPDAPDLSAELAEAQAALDAANTQVAELSATEVAVATTVVAPTATEILPTPTPKPCYPHNLDEVVVIRDPRASLFEATGENLAGKPIMGIYVDSDGNRVQYSIGVTFFIYEDLITADGGLEFYRVFGPLGKDYLLELYVRADHIKLFDADPDLYLCTD